MTAAVDLLPDHVICQPIGATRRVLRRVLSAELGTLRGMDRVFLRVVQEGEAGAVFGVDYPPGWSVQTVPPGTVEVRSVRTGPAAIHLRWYGVTRDGWLTCLATPRCPTRFRDERVMRVHVAMGHR